MGPADAIAFKCKADCQVFGFGMFGSSNPDGVQFKVRSIVNGNEVN